MNRKIYQYLAMGVILLGLNAGSVNAQLNCGTTQAMDELFRKYPDVKAQHEELRKNSLQNLQHFKNTNPSTQSAPQYIIPIVFHIIHQYGAEDISDAQVQDQVNILNRDFRKLNADTSTVVPFYQGMIADTKIEFRLATKDPDGNCTNGIVRYHSHKTNAADDNSKLDPWPRERYLNVWVTKTIGSAGVAGYAYYPSAVTGILFTIDGILILHDYIGSIGTGSVGTSRALTHEIGHYLNLAHPWGSTNQPGVSCGDDGIADTPVTKGHTTCTTADLNDSLSCPPDTIIQNTQNYMEYAYCSRMFTLGQGAAMQQTLNEGVSYRNNLWTYQTHVLTGTDTASLTANPYTFPTILSSLPVCVPVADFSANRYYVCQGGTITFTDHSWRAPITSRLWTIPNGSPNTSTAVSPTITFPTWGWQTVTLDVTNSAGTGTITKTNFVFVAPPWYDFFGAFSEGFEGNNFQNLWIRENMEYSYPEWSVTSSTAYTGSRCVSLLAYGTDRGLTDAMISPSYNLSTCSNAVLSFKYSCATSATVNADIDEKLNVWVSVNCGQTWTLRKTLGTTVLCNAGYSPSGFLPSGQGQWATCTVNLSGPDLQPNVRFRFEYISGPYSNNIFIDDINLQATVGMEEVQNYFFDLNVYPNPSNGEDLVNVAYNLSTTEEISISLVDMTGREVVVTSKQNVAAGEHVMTFNRKSLDLKAGIYLVKISNGTSYETRKLVITN